ncbi:MAG: Stp1/IreP family PP2C-type Ser/Thr phosphatase [Candidatus Eisenbacteria bacterium]|nr:Stp1/IreP family PP2C-type Ser/Thr phosphatase [Candidatus Eisenbacteria bacterium]
MTLRIAAATDVGLRRDHNEDFHAFWSPADPTERERRGELMVVADGMGGSVAGEVASRAAVEAVVHHYRDRAEAPQLALQRALEAAHRTVYRMSRERPELAGMGTTCTAVAVRGTEVRIAHVGDSRAYLVRDERIRQLTADHSLVQQLVEQQLMTPEQARVDPRRNVLTRSMGVGEAVEVDAAELSGGLRTGDTLLLCSDGLHGLVHDDEMASHASQNDLDRACAELVSLARARGGHDNITVMLARLATAEAPGD